MPEVTSWDSPAAAVKFIIGLLLSVGLFSFFIHGIKEFIFITKNKNVEAPLVLDLTTDSNREVPQQRFVQLTGYVGEPIEYVYIDPHSNLPPTTVLYYPVYSTLSQNQVNRNSLKAFVYDNQANQNFLNLNKWETPVKNSQVTVQGTVELEKIPNTILDQAGVSSNENIPLLVPQKLPPKLSKLLIWFIPVTIGFGIGIYLVVNWLLTFKRQFFS